jgi:hypothetical protein
VNSNDEKRTGFIEGLRALAGWLEENPAAPVPYVQDVQVPVTTNAQVEEAAAALGVDPVYDAEGNASIEVTLGALKYRVYGYADFSEHLERHHERSARQWAERQGLVIADVQASVAS